MDAKPAGNKDDQELDSNSEMIYEYDFWEVCRYIIDQHDEDKHNRTHASHAAENKPAAAAKEEDPFPTPTNGLSFW